MSTIACAWSHSGLSLIIVFAAGRMSKIFISSRLCVAIATRRQRRQRGGNAAATRRQRGGNAAATRRPHGGIAVCGNAVATRWQCCLWQRCGNAVATRRQCCLWQRCVNAAAMLSVATLWHRCCHAVTTLWQCCGNAVPRSRWPVGKNATAWCHWACVHMLWHWAMRWQRS
jgi:hypothetical protein